MGGILPTDFRQALSDAIENCYRVFAKYPAPKTWHASPERKPEELLAALTKVPLRELPDDPLGKYAFWAMTTVADAEHYKHFLPRILELATTHDPTGLGLTGWVIAGKLAMAQWRDWPAEEIEVVERSFLAGWERFVSEPAGFVEAGDWFEGVIKIATILPQAFEIWQKAPDMNAALAISDVVGHIEELVFFPERLDRWKERLDEDTRQSLAVWLTTTVRPRLWDIVGRVTFEDSFESHSVERAIDMLERKVAVGSATEGS